MKIKNFILLALAAVALTGCKSLYGKYERPAVKAEGVVRSPLSDTDTLVVSDTASFGNLPWRSVFTDPQLQSHIATALENNYDLLNAALNVKMAEAQLKSAQLSFLPSFAFTPQGTISSWDGNAAVKTYSLPVSASWTIDLFGTLLSAKRSSQMALIGMKDYQLAARTRLISNVANLYYTLLMLDKELELIDEMEVLAKDTWETMKLQKEYGNVRSTGVQSAESNYYSVQAQKVGLKRQLREAENALSLLLGQSARSIARGKFDGQSLPTNFSTGISLQMLNNRPDVHAAEMSLAQCFYNVQTARSRFYPTLTLSAQGGYTNSGGMGITNPAKLLLSAVGSLTQPIFQRGQLIAGLKVAKIQYERAYNTWQQMVLSAGNEVSNALVLYNASAEKSDIEAKQIVTLRQNVEDTKMLLTESRGSYLEVITAQQTLLQVELSKVQDDFNKMQAVVNLYMALGGGK